MVAEGAGTVGKALSVLTLLGEYPHGATAAQIAEQVDYPFSTVYRLLHTLVSTEYVAYDPQGKRYRLGLRIYQLGQKVANARGFDGTALPVLQRLTEVTGESSVLHVLDGGQSLTVCKVDGPQFRTTTDAGARSPLHTTASGKALLAFADPAIREHLLQTIELTPRTPYSLTDREELARQVENIRTEGWAGQSQENDIGMAAIAAPVLSGSSRLIAAVTLAAPLFRADLEDLRKHLARLREATAELSVKLPQRP